MDRGGYGFEVDLDEIDKVEEFNFKSFSMEMFLSLCIISGCDYLESIKGIGFKKAYRILSEQGNDDITGILKKIRREGKFVVPYDYERNFEKALLTFKF